MDPRNHVERLYQFLFHIIFYLDIFIVLWMSIDLIRTFIDFFDNKVGFFFITIPCIVSSIWTMNKIIFVNIKNEKLKKTTICLEIQGGILNKLFYKDKLKNSCEKAQKKIKEKKNCYLSLENTGIECSYNKLKIFESFRAKRKKFISRFSR